MSLLLSYDQLRCMHRHAQEAFPEECCGVLMGLDTPEGNRWIGQVMPLANTQPGMKERRYLIAPQALIQAEKAAQAHRWEVVGIYHSHPNHPCQPSAFDRSHALPVWSYVIISCMQGQCVQTQSWRLQENRAAFDSEPVVLVGPM